MAAAKKITILALAISLALPSVAQGGRGGGPPPGQRRGPGYSQPSGQPGGNKRPGPHFGDWLRNSKSLTPAEKKKALEKDPNFQKLPAERQQKLRERLDWFNALPPDRQERILSRMEAWEHMTPEQHQRARALFARMRELPDDRRNLLRDQFRALMSMDTEQRQRTMNSDQYKRNYSDDERDILAKWLELRESDTQSAPPTLGDRDN